jgi:uncharacterized membrane protein
MPTLRQRLAAHTRLVFALVAGLLASVVVPHVAGPITRALLGWNVGVWVYLVAVSIAMWKADQGDVQRIAVRQAESALAVLLVVTLGAIASLAAIVYELAAAKGPGAGHAWPQLAFVVVTVAGSWLLVPTLFALSYASLYYGRKPGKGLVFPTTEPRFEPDYADFLYYAFNIAVAAQTSDVNVTTREMRRLTLVQSILAFAFNATVLAFSINIAAGLF